MKPQPSGIIYFGGLMPIYFRYRRIISRYAAVVIVVAVVAAAATYFLASKKEVSYSAASQVAVSPISLSGATTPSAERNITTELAVLRSDQIARLATGSLGNISIDQFIGSTSSFGDSRSNVITLRAQRPTADEAIKLVDAWTDAYMGNHKDRVNDAIASVNSEVSIARDRLSSLQADPASTSVAVSTAAAGYQSLLSRQQQLAVQAIDARPMKIQPVKNGVVEVGGRSLKLAAMAGFVSALLCAILLAVREQFVARVRVVEDIEVLTGKPAIGLLAGPSSSVDTAHRVLAGLKHRRSVVIAPAEAVKTSTDRSQQLALDVARLSATSGFKTLFISLGTRNQSDSVSLAKVLADSGDEQLIIDITDGNKEPILITSDENLSILNIEVDSEEEALLHGEDFRQLFGRLEKEFDRIIVCTSPILGSNVAVTIAAAVGTVVIAVSLNSKAVTLGRAIDHMTNARAEVAGFAASV